MTNFENLWKETDQNWCAILETFRQKLPCDENVMYNDDGIVVPCSRPLLESAICDKQARLRRFFYYCIAAGLMTMPECDVKISKEKSPSGGRIIEIGGFTSMPLGEHEKHTTD